MCSQRDYFFWIAVVCNYSWGGSFAVSLRCWQRMPFAFEVLHLASGKRVHNLTKRNTFCLVPSLGQAFNQMGSSDVEIYTIHIQNSTSKEKEKRIMKMQLDHFIKRVYCTLPPPFEIANQNPVKACLCALLMPLEWKRYQEDALHPNLHLAAWTITTHILFIILSLNMFECVLFTCFCS